MSRLHTCGWPWRALVACLLLGLSLGNGCASIPPPQEIKVVPPGPSIPPDLARFSGRWVGKWDDSRDHQLIVSEIRPPREIVVYAFRAVPGFPRWSRESATYEDGLLRIDFPGMGTVATYQMNVDGSLNGVYGAGGNYSRAKMIRARD